MSDKDALEYALTQARPKVEQLSSGEYADWAEARAAETFNNVVEEISKLNLLPSGAFERLIFK